MKARKERALDCLTAGVTVAKTAETVGAHRATVFGWLHEPEFAHALNERRRLATESAIATLQSAANEAAGVLLNEMRNAKSGIKVWAAQTVLQFALRGIETAELESRLNEVEDLLKIQREARRGDSSHLSAVG